MARALIGMSNTGINAVRLLLRSYYKQRETMPGIVLLGTNDTPKAEALHDKIVLVPTIGVMQAQAKTLTEASCVILVWGPPIVLDYMKDVPKPDVQVKPNTFTYRFQPVSATALGELIDEGMAKDNEYEIQAPEVSVIPTMLHRTPGSIAGAILNYLYSMPDPNLRMKIQHVIYTWLGTEATVEQLEDTIYKSMAAVPKKRPVALNRLVTFLESDDGTTAKTAMNWVRQQKLAEKPVSSKVIAKKFGLSEYDVSYALKSSNNALRSGTIVDAKPLNEFFWERKSSDKAKVRTKDKKAKSDGAATEE